eukprot:6500220-Alexandrium_andersonii.AAC.1
MWSAAVGWKHGARGRAERLWNPFIWGVAFVVFVTGAVAPYSSMRFAEGLLRWGCSYVRMRFSARRTGCSAWSSRSAA